MATGDKIFLADKETLDSVKEDTTSLINKSNEILDAVGDNKSVGIDNTRRSKLIYGSRSTGSGSWIDILNMTNSSGKLHAVVMNCQPSAIADSPNVSTVQVIVDGTTVYNGTASVTSGVVIICLVDKSFVLSSDTSTRLQLLNNQTINIGVYGLTPYTGSGSNSSIPNVISPEPIKWNTSLVVRAQGTRLPSTVFYYYELD